MRSQRGAVAVKVALLLTFLMGMAALSVDIGVLTVHKRSLQGAADLAAMAGVQELPQKPADAQAIARDYLLENTVTADEIMGISAEAGNTELVVNLSRNAPLFFARVLGHEATQVVVRARARVKAEKRYPDLVPWGIPEKPYVVGTEYELKQGAGSPSKPSAGNYQIVYLEKNMNGPQYQDWVANGYDGAPIQIGDLIDPHTGALGTNTIDGVAERKARSAGYNCSYPDPEPRCPMIVTVVVVDGFGPGKSQPLEVVRFAKFLLMRVEPDNPGRATIHGIYLGPVDLSELDPTVMDKKFFLVR